MPGFHGQIRACVGVALLVGLLAATAIGAPSADAKGPREMVVTGETLSAPVRLNANESFAFMLGPQVRTDIAALEDRAYLSFEMIGGGFEGQARLYLGTQTEPPLFLIHPVTSVTRLLGPHPLAILAWHGIPLDLTDPFRLADPADDPPVIFSGGEQIIPVALPNAGSGGLAGESNNGPQPLLWASLAALAAVTSGVGLRLRKRRR